MAFTSDASEFMKFLLRSIEDSVIYDVYYNCLRDHLGPNLEFDFFIRRRMEPVRFVHVVQTELYLEISRKFNKKPSRR